jgi:electron transfer flavoprotein alpha subunit
MKTLITIDLDECTGCGLCIDACPYGFITIENSKAIISKECTLCKACIGSCPREALHLRKVQHTPDIDLKQCKDIWVFMEHHSNALSQVSLELLGKGSEIALARNMTLCGLLLGNNVSHLAYEAIHFGADRVYVMESSLLKDFRTYPYTIGAAQLIRKYKPEIVIVGATTEGRDFSSALATELGTGLTADCTELAIDDTTGFLIQTRPAFGGNMMATIICPKSRPQMATVRPKVMKSLPKNPARKGDIINEKLTIDEVIKTTVLDFIEDTTDSVDITDADVIVSGGRGLGKKENFVLIEELARTLKAGVGGSRVAVDSGWISYPHQVGQTGRTVRPKIYFAIGISGAVQHLAGMQTSETIVAINNDPNAPIFQFATFGIIGDLFEVVPTLTEEIRKLST